MGRLPDEDASLLLSRVCSEKEFLGTFLVKDQRFGITNEDVHNAGRAIVDMFSRPWVDGDERGAKLSDHVGKYVVARIDANPKPVYCSNAHLMTHGFMGETGKPLCEICKVKIVRHSLFYTCECDKPVCRLCSNQLT